MLETRPDVKIFLDVDDSYDTRKLQDIVKESRNFLLLITEGVLDSVAQFEIQTALEMKKNIILVHDEKSCPFPKNAPQNIKAILEPKAVPYYREKAFRDVSIQQILSKTIF